MKAPQTEGPSIEQAQTPCPNPRCNGFVSAGQTACSMCGHELLACPSCAQFMSKTIARCGRCGFRLVEPSGTTPPTGEAAQASVPKPISEPAPSIRSGTSAPVVLRFEASRESVRPIMAEVYHQAALADPDMVATSRILEKARTTLLTEPDALKIWRRLEEGIGAAEPHSLRPPLMTLRKWFTQQLSEQQTRRLGGLFERNADTGWREWMRAYAEALAAWRLGLCQSLLQAPLPFPEAFRSPHDFRRATALILHARWPEVHPFLSQLAQQEFLHPYTRARLLISVGQVYLYYFTPRDLALPFFQQAQQLAPGSVRVLAAFGDYYKEINDFSAARSYLDQAMRASPDSIEPYVGLGELEEKQGRFEEARSWFIEAINQAGDDSLGYTRLLRMYGRPELIEKYESHIEPLAESARAVDETGEYKTYLDVGDAYLASRRFSRAQGWYERAIQLEPNRLDGYCWKGFAFLDEGESRYDAAREAFQKAIQVAPESYNGYWGAGHVCERQGKWAEAAEWYAQAAQRQPEMKAALLSRIGDMQFKLKEYDLAESTLLAALKLDPGNDAVILDLAEAYYLKLTRKDDALRLHKQIREIKGDAYEASYQNRVGNVFYHQDQYELSAEHYLNAIRSDPNRVVFYSNLAGAYREMKQWEKAREHFAKALQLTGDKAKFDIEVAGIYNREGNDQYAQQRYDQAMGCYTEAIALMPATPRYPSNRAMAREQMLPTVEKPEAMIELALGDARTALQLAQGKEGMEDQVKEYTEQVASLEQKCVFLNRYGQSALTLKPVHNPIRVEIRSDALPIFLNAELNNLSAELQDQLVGLRGSMRQRYGFNIPIVLFGELAASSDFGGNYRVRIMGEEVAMGRLSPDQKYALCTRERLTELGLTGTSPFLWPLSDDLPGGFWLEQSSWAKAESGGLELLGPRDFLVRHLHGVVTQHLGKFCTFDVATSLLTNCGTPDSAEIKSNPRKLIRLTQKLKDLLKQNQALLDLTPICRDVNQSVSGDTPHQSSPPPPRPELDPGITSLTLYFNPHSTVDQAQVAGIFAGVQVLLFEERGIVVPRITIQQSDAIDANDFQLQVDAEKLPVVHGLAADEVWVFAPFASLQDRFPEGRASIEPNSGEPACILKASPEVRQEAEARGYVVRGPFEYFISCLGAELRRRTDPLLTRETVEHYLREVKADYPMLVNLSRTLFSVEELTLRLRAFLSQKTSIRNLPRVLEEFLTQVG